MRCESLRRDCAHPCLTRTHARQRKLRPDLRAAMTAHAANEIRLHDRQADVIGPLVGADRCRVRAPVIAARDQHVANAGGAHLAEADLLRGGRHAGIVARPSHHSKRKAARRRLPVPPCCRLARSGRSERETFILAKPTPAKPKIIIAQVEGSGTADVMGSSGGSMFAPQSVWSTCTVVGKSKPGLGSNISS